jgi:DNA-binding NarL/FixJ family response regulator
VAPARERQVADLAARGMSIREIAEALFVTVKTVSDTFGRRSRS